MTTCKELLNEFTVNHERQGRIVAKLYDMLGEQRERAEKADEKVKAYEQVDQTIGATRYWSDRCKDAEARVKEPTKREADLWDAIAHARKALRQGNVLRAEKMLYDENLTNWSKGDEH